MIPAKFLKSLSSDSLPLVKLLPNCSLHRFAFRLFEQLLERVLGFGQEPVHLRQQRQRQLEQVFFQARPQLAQHARTAASPTWCLTGQRGRRSGQRRSRHAALAHGGHDHRRQLVHADDRRAQAAGKARARPRRRASAARADSPSGTIQASAPALNSSRSCRTSSSSGALSSCLLVRPVRRDCASVSARPADEPLKRFSPAAFRPDPHNMALAARLRCGQVQENGVCDQRHPAVLCSTVAASVCGGFSIFRAARVSKQLP